MNALRLPAVIILGLAFILAPTGVRADAKIFRAPSSVKGTLVVTGAGEAEAKPDRARITAGVETVSKTASMAVTENAKTMNQLLDTLKSLGIEAKDIQTHSIGLSPIQDRPRPQGGGPPQEPRITAYRASNLVSVTLRDIDRAAMVLDRISWVANRIDGIDFSLADPAPHLDKARAKAVADAKRRAQLYAQAAGIKLGPIIGLEETGGGGPSGARMMMSGAAGGFPVVPGRLTFSAGVTITYAIKVVN